MDGGKTFEYLIELPRTPGHIHMREVERSIEKGINAGGGNSFIFSVPGVCDGIAMGHSGMHYSLPTRELIADMIECVVQAHRLDGLVMLTNCDKITPGMLMAAARLNVPTIVVTAANPSICVSTSTPATRGTLSGMIDLSAPTPQ